MTRLVAVLTVNLYFIPYILSICHIANWWSSFDNPGWSTCTENNTYIQGLYRNKDDARKTSFIFLLEMANCCTLGNLTTRVEKECKYKTLHFERIENTTTAFDGTAMIMSRGTVFPQKHGVGKMYRGNKSDSKFNTSEYFTWENTAGKPGNWQWIGWRNKLFTNKTLKISFWIKFVKRIPKLSDNFGIKAYGVLYNKFVRNCKADMWCYVEKRIQRRKNSKAYDLVMLIFDSISHKQKVHVAKLKVETLQNNFWETCPSGFFLNGLKRTSNINNENRLRNIKTQRCCKPKDHPTNWGRCYEKDVTESFGKHGWGSCKEGYFITGFFKGKCDWLNCIEKIKCCQTAATYIPSQYRFLHHRMTWYGAENFCKKWGGHLATITSASQNHYIRNELKRRYIINIVSGWIGYTDRETEGSFRWINPLNSKGYTNWQRKQSKEPNGGEKENCVEMIAAKKYGITDWMGKWNDFPCNGLQRPICQRTTVNETRTISQNPTNGTKSNSTHHDQLSNKGNSTNSTNSTKSKLIILNNLG